MIITSRVSGINVGSFFCGTSDDTEVILRFCDSFCFAGCVSPQTTVSFTTNYTSENIDIKGSVILTAGFGT